MVPLARTDAEAKLYLSLVPCETCGHAGFPATPTPILIDAAPHTRFDGPCPSCGTHRHTLLRYPTPPPLPPPSLTTEPARVGERLDFGGDAPSELLDPGDWLAVADQADLMDDVPLAAAALEEVLKFIPSGADRVPPDAFRGDAGREVHTREPGRFERAPLAWAVATYRRIAETPQAPPAATVPPPVAPAVITGVGYLSMTKLRLRVLRAGVERDYTFATVDVSLDPAIRADEAFLADFGGSDLYAPILAQVRKAFQLELAPVPVPLHP